MEYYKIIPDTKAGFKVLVRDLGDTYMNHASNFDVALEKLRIVHLYRAEKNHSWDSPRLRSWEKIS